MGKIYDQLRDAIEASDKSRYRLWQETGIDQGQLTRFMNGTAGLSVENIERLLEALGLDVVIQPRKAKKSRGKGGKHG